jgi:hypothetical protein
VRSPNKGPRDIPRAFVGLQHLVIMGNPAHHRKLRLVRRGPCLLLNRKHAIDQIVRSLARQIICIRPSPNNPQRPCERFLRSNAPPSAEKKIGASGQGAEMETLAAFENRPSKASIACICPHRKGYDSILPQGIEIPLPSARFYSCLHLNALQIHRTFPMMRTRSISSSDKKIGAYSLLSLKRTSFRGCFSIRLTMIVSSTPTA